jgi:hypothetical protein
MKLTEFILKFSPEEKSCDFPFDDAFKRFPRALERFADMYYRKIVRNCDAESIDFHDLQQPDIDEL